MVVAEEKGTRERGDLVATRRGATESGGGTCPVAPTVRPHDPWKQYSLDGCNVHVERQTSDEKNPFGTAGSMPGSNTKSHLCDAPIYLLESFTIQGASSG